MSEGGVHARHSQREILIKKRSKTAEIRQRPYIFPTSNYMKNLGLIIPVLILA
jgi:hypothetical protein